MTQQTWTDEQIIEEAMHIAVFYIARPWLPLYFESDEEEAKFLEKFRRTKIFRFDAGFITFGRAEFIEREETQWELEIERAIKWNDEEKPWRGKNRIWVHELSENDLDGIVFGTITERGYFDASY